MRGRRGGSGTFEVLRPLVNGRAVQQEGFHVGDPRVHLEDECVPFCVCHRGGWVQILPFLWVCRFLVMQRFNQVQRVAHRHQRRHDIKAFCLVRAGVTILVFEHALERGQPLAVVEALVQLNEGVYIGGLEKGALARHWIRGVFQIVQRFPQFLDVLLEASFDVFVFGDGDADYTGVLLQPHGHDLALQARDGQAGEGVENVNEAGVVAGDGGDQFGVDARCVGDLVERDSGGGYADEGVWMGHGFDFTSGGCEGGREI